MEKPQWRTRKSYKNGLEATPRRPLPALRPRLPPAAAKLWARPASTLSAFALPAAAAAAQAIRRRPRRSAAGVRERALQERELAGMEQRRRAAAGHGQRRQDSASLRR